MKTTLKILLTICIASSLYSCVVDNGNYDYKSTGKAIEIEINTPDKINLGYNFVLGEEIVIDGVEITYKDETIKESDLSYEWLISNMDPIATDVPELRLAGELPVGLYTALLIITDKRYEIKYTSPTFGLRVTSEFTHGWAVLGERDGSSVLGYVNNRNDEFQPFISNVYALNNSGEVLGGQPVSLTYHIYQSSADGYQYFLNITQNGGIGAVDLAASSMAKYASLNNEFLNPPSSGFKSIAYKANSVFALTEAGDVYIRYEAMPRSNDHVPHATKFSNTPIYIENGMRITHWVSYSAMTTMMYNLDYIMAFDDKNKRVIKLTGADGTARPINYYESTISPGDPGTDGTTEFPDLSFPGPDNLSGYDMLFMSGYGGTWDDAFMDVTICVVSVLKSNANGKYYFYSFRYVSGLTGYHIELNKFYEMPIQNLGQDIVYTSYLVGEAYLFFTTNDNKDLYFMDIERGYSKLLYQSSSPITALKAGETSSLMSAWGMGEPGPYYEKLALGTQDGKFIILDVSPSVMVAGPSMAQELKTYDTELGKIVSIEFMANDAFTSSSVSRASKSR